MASYITFPSNFTGFSKHGILHDLSELKELELTRYSKSFDENQISTLKS